MTESKQPKEINVNNDRALKKLARAIANSRGHFGLILARCNYVSLTEQIVADLRAICPVPWREFHLPPSIETLYAAICEELNGDRPQGLLVFGLESVEDVEQILKLTNRVREEFRQNFPFPFVLWVNDDLLQKLTRLAPDFKSWAAIPIKFEMVARELRDRLCQTLDSVLETLLEMGGGRFIDEVAIAPSPGSFSLGELETALRDVQQGSLPLEPPLEANLHFAIAREIGGLGKREKAKECYDLAEGVWLAAIARGEIAPEDFKHYGCLLFYMGLWWRRHATLHRLEHRLSCEKARGYFQRCIEALQRSDRPELEQKFINSFGEVLSRLDAWEELQAIAERAVTLHQNCEDRLRLAYGYGLQAEVALHGENWTDAKQYAESALQHNRNCSLNAPKSEDLLTQNSADEEQEYHRNYYRLLLARSQWHLEEVSEAIGNLEAAKKDSFPERDPSLYIRILDNLGAIAFAREEYLRAFELKQERQSVEQEYGLRAFVGAGRLQARRRVSQMTIASSRQKLTVSAEIAASGRLQDIERLIQRIERPDCKLTTIYGQSGVGKSSLVQAGLIPVLKQLLVEARDVIPVLLQVYSDWEKSLGVSYARSYEEVRGLSLPILLDSMATFLAELRKASDRNMLTVLIFDQFEEFFFAYRDPQQRKPFFEFLQDCLNIPYVKVILALREDYLHYLLECNRITNLEIINNDILNKHILYYLGNLSPRDARSVIETLTQKSQFHLESGLIDALVADLARGINEVRPIELQVVGSQLQSEQITTLARFEERGPKEALVERFLGEIIRDCGDNNENFVRIILYLLTDDNNTRPLKTRGEISAEIDLEAERLDLILTILVRSGLVFKVPGFPTERYQLVHDYLVPFIRQKQAATLVAQVEEEREKRRLTEARLNKVLKDKLRTTRRATYTLAGLLAAIGTFALTATIVIINLSISNLVAKSSDNEGIERLISAIQAGKTLQRFPLAIPGLQLKVNAELQTAISQKNETFFLAHDNSVSKIVFSQDGKWLASASEDLTLKIWDRNGKAVATSEKHDKKILSIAFSFDGKLIASASEDKKIRIWKVEHNPNSKNRLTINLFRIIPTSEIINDINISWNNQFIAFPSGKNIKLWNISEGILEPIIKGHQGIITNIAFSPNEQILASADRHGIINIWNLDEKEKKTINSYGIVEIRFSSDGNTLIILSKDGSIKHYKLDEIKILAKNTNFIGRMDVKENTIIALSQDTNIMARVGDKYRNFWSIYKNNQRSPNGNQNDTLINDLRFSPDGTQIAFANQDKTIRLRNIVPVKHWLAVKPQVEKVHFNHDSNILAISRSDISVELLDRQGEHKKILPADGSILSVSPDGQAIVTRSAEDVIKLHKLNGQTITLRKHPKGIARASISPDGKTVISVSYDNKLRFWNSDGQLIKEELIPNWEISKFYFSPDSQRVVFFTKDDRVQIFDNDGILINSLKSKTHKYKINNIYFSPNSKQIAITGDNNFIYLYTKDGKEISVLTGHKNSVLDLSFSLDSSMIASISRNNRGRSNIRLWKRDGSPIKSWNEYAIWSIKFSPDNTKIATSNYDNIIQFWDLEGREIDHVTHNDRITDFSFSPDGNILVSASVDNIVRLWNGDSQNIQLLQQHLDKVNQIVFNPNGQNFVSRSEDGMVQLWRRDGHPIKTLQLARDNKDLNNTFIRSRIEFSEDGSTIALIEIVDNQDELNHKIQLWDSKGEKINMFPGKKSWDTSNITFSPGGKTIALVEKVSALKLWNSDDFTAKSLSEHQDTINNISFSPDGKLLASASDDRTIKLWNLESDIEDEDFPLFEHTDKVNSVSFSPDGKFLASASDDCTIKLWNLEDKDFQLFKHTDKVNSISFSPDGKLLASASDDKTIQLWSRDDRSFKRLKHSPLEHSDAVKDIFFSPNSKMIASKTKNGIINIWRIDNGKKITKSIEHEDVLGFSPDSRIFATKNYRSVHLLLLQGVWFKEIEFLLRGKILKNLQLKQNNTKFLIEDSDKISIVNFDLDKLLEKGCDLAQNYLKNNPELTEKDRRLCD